MKIKHLFIGILLATTALNVAAQPVSKQYFVPKAGTLISLMTEDEANSITHLTLTGKINAEDFKDRKSTRLNSSHSGESRMPSSA